MRIAAALILSVATALALGAATSASDTAVATEARLNGYLVKARPGISSTQLADITDRVLGAGWEVVNGKLPGHYHVQPRSGLAVASTHAAAWEAVHALDASGLTVWVEPAFPDSLQFLQDASGPVGECSPAWSGFGATPNDPGAMKDSQWSLKDHPGVNAQAAWALFGANGAGANVVVGHPDTGYLDHAAIKAARLGAGFDFTTGRSSATDIAAAGNLQWPGHGTRTSSVIAGRSFVVPQGKRQISGVAPAAWFMPLKVAHRVLLLPFLEFDTENLAMAIHAAAIGDPNFVEQRADVISMSLGGKNSRALEDALRVAEDANVIVLAAAGNKVPGHVVVYPARYSNVLAIAASNSTGQPWPDTSRGDTIAVSAPGQNVWSAKRRQIDGQSYDCAEMSSGTSYAVATTAGVAALWLSYHRMKGDLAQLTNRPRTFRELVRKTAWDPGKGWDSKDMGPGIADAKKLLEEPLPGRVARATNAACDNLVAISSIVPAVAAAELVTGSRDIPHACVAMGQLGDEMASLYSTDERETGAFERFLKSAQLPADVKVLRNETLTLDLSKPLRGMLNRANGMRANHPSKT